jgi:protein gp37
VFCASLADVFEGHPDTLDWLFDLGRLISATPYLDWLLLTKRPENVMNLITSYMAGRIADLWLADNQNVWIGVTAENQEMADKRIPILMDIPASVRFVSVEPMLEEIYFPFMCANSSPEVPVIDWVICGGESGPGARPMNLEWAKYLLNQCENASVPFFFKQVGGTKRIDGHWGGDLLDGCEYKEFPK